MSWPECGEVGSIARSLLEGYEYEIDRSNVIPQDLLSKLVEAGFYSFEGRSLSWLACTVRSLAYRSAAVAHSVLVSASAWVAAGGSIEGILALSITEPGGGSDVKANLETRARRAGPDTFLVRGTKVFTSNAPYANAFVVLARDEAGPTLYLVRKSDRIDYELLDLTGLRGTGAATIHYKDAEAERIGSPGRGLKEALGGINIGRLGYAAIALGIADRALEEAVRRAMEKQVFGKPLIEYQGLRWRIAEIYSKIRSLASLLETVTSSTGSSWIVDPVLASVAKLEGAQLARDAAWLYTQIMGGRGLERWSLGDRLQRDARALDIGEGAREVLLDYLASKAVRIYGTVR